MMKSFASYCRRLLAALAAGLLIFASAIAVAHAETHIDNGYLDQDTIWDATHSPYIIEDPITVPKGISLTIEPGVSIVGTQAVDGYSLVDVEGGHLSIIGDSQGRVSLNGYGGITLSREATATIEYADISLPNGVGVFDSSLDMASSTIMNAEEAVHLRSSSVSIIDSQIIHNDAGLFVEPSAGSGIHPLSLSEGDLPVSDPADSISSVTISGSDITENRGAAIENQDSSPVVAMNDWWGSDVGPTFSGSNDLIGAVEYDPWQKRASTAKCCSSILFIPGLQASRLYSPLREFGATTTVRGWEPLSNAFAKTLYLNPDGSSINPNIYSGGPIDKAYGISDVYGTFMKFLDGLASKGTIGEWRAFGYDWRKPISEVVAGAEKKATSTESLIDTVLAMASTSKTGKVTLVAHSNGGLVAKYLLKTLTDIGKADLVDKVISVAVPYLGTPQAIPSLLYGDNESFAYGILLKQSVAQKLGQNMPSAYSLLPSATYFNQVIGPTIVYANGSSTPVTDSGLQDTLVSSKVNKILMAAAESLHAVLDPFEWPKAIERWSLVGWGNSTVKSVVYKNNGSDSHTASTTNLGDGTVVAQSAEYNAGTTTALDLRSISKLESGQFNHQNILDSSTTEEVIDKIIEDQSDSLGGIPGVSIGLPTQIDSVSRIVVSTHSPVDLHVYDQKGNHTGIIPSPTGSGIADDVATFYEAKIPGSSFEQNGGDGTGDDSDTEISLPADSGQQYSVSIQGNGVGEFTYEVQRYGGDALQSDISYSGLPTTPLTVASTTIDSSTDASTSAPLIVDVNGDGTMDIIAKPGSNLDPMSFFEVLKKAVLSLLGLKDKRINEFTNRISKIEMLFEKNKIKKVSNKLGRLETVFGHKKFKNLTPVDKDSIADMINSFLKTFED